MNRSEQETARAREVLAVSQGDVRSRLDRFLRKRYPKLPHGLLHKLTRKRRITVNGRRTEPAYRLQTGDQVQIWSEIAGFRLPADFFEKRARKIRESAGFRRHFRVLHEDDALIVLDKPAGLVVHPDRHHRGDTLLDLLKAYLPSHFAPASDYRPAFVHRLDRGTSGVIVAAKRKSVAHALEKAFRSRSVEKTYRVLVAGRPSRRRGTIRRNIEKRTMPSGVTRFAATDGGSQGTPRAGQVSSSPKAEPAPGRGAVTSYQTIASYEDATLLEVRLESGRTHQIRVHLAKIGLPVVGDGDYGNRRLNREFRERFGLLRLFLHAAELRFEHPTTGARLTCRAPLPPDLLRTIDALETILLEESLER